MKKLKQMSGPYSIGFELSSTAHGFVATDPNGNVLYHGKQPVMGTRVFKEGQHAAEARMPRTSRRGIQRRRGREHEMERVFAPVISSIDPDFFIRRRMSYKLGKFGSRVTRSDSAIVVCSIRSRRLPIWTSPLWKQIALWIRV